MMPVYTKKTFFAKNWSVLPDGMFSNQKSQLG
jgi:hypothetical protein